MWKAKFSVYDSKGTFAPRAKKFKVIVYGYMLNYFIQKNNYYYTLVAFIDGEESVIKNYIKDLKKDKKIDKLESHGNFFVCRLKESKSGERKKLIGIFYNPLLIQIRPFVITSDGWEEMEIASFERKYLEEALKALEEKFEFKLNYIKNENFNYLGILNILPNLTKKQRNAIESALSEGYYEYPRKTDVVKLAKKNKLSFSTFQEHLRKAENKLVPFAVKKSK